MAKQPIYVKIMSDIENQIKDETLKSGDQIPTEKELCELYNTSRMTVNKAISRLCEKNLIERIAGKGSFVKEHRVIKNLQLGTNGSFSDDMIATGKVPGSKLIEYKLVKGKEVPHVKHVLKLKDDDFIHYFVRVRTGDSYLSASIIPTIDIQILEGSLYKYINKLGYSIDGIDAEYSAVLPTDKQKELLQVDQVALFKSEHVTFLSDGRPFEYISTYYRGDQYTYSLKTVFDE